MYVMSDFDRNLKEIYDSGFDVYGDRTGEGMRVAYGLTTRVDISKHIPIPTKREVKFKSIIKEILWFISGSDNINDLESAGSKIWTPWKDPEFAERGGFQDGSIGYGYGPNLIHFGADLSTLDSDPGFNQLEYVLNELRTNPKSRRILFTLWRPDKLGKYDVKLPPCHHTYQFIPEPDENGNLTRLSCMMYQRSCDYPIGVMMGNLLGGTLFTYLIAQQVGMTPSKLIHFGGHCHIYHNAMEATGEYLSRETTPSSPVLKINKKQSIYDYSIDDFTVEDYHPLPAIKFPIAI